LGSCRDNREFSHVVEMQIPAAVPIKAALTLLYLNEFHLEV